jgi:hypothetical protein
MANNAHLAQGSYIICGAARQPSSDMTLFMSPKLGLPIDLVITDKPAFKVYSCISWSFPMLIEVLVGRVASPGVQVK